MKSKITIEKLNQDHNKHMTKHLGIEYTEIGDDYLCGKMPVDTRTFQPMGILHGGASVVLAESLGSLAANLYLGETNYYAVGLDVNANHVKSARSGYVYGKASLQHAGRATQVWTIEIHNDAQELVCLSRLTMAVLEKR